MTAPQGSDGGISVLTRKTLGNAPGKRRGTGAHTGQPTPIPERGLHGNDHMPWAPSPESCRGEELISRVQNPTLAPRHRAPPGSGTGRWVRLRTVTEQLQGSRKQPCLPSQMFSKDSSSGAARKEPARHLSFSRRLLFLWPLSSSSFLSSLLCSWALLAGSRDLSLVPLPA